jgi:hypothetical protein
MNQRHETFENETRRGIDGCRTHDLNVVLTVTPRDRLKKTH